jgi:hypothetical protein
MVLRAEKGMSEFLATKHCRWADRDARERFRNDLKSGDAAVVVTCLRRFVEGLEKIDKVEPAVRARSGEMELEEEEP